MKINEKMNFNLSIKNESKLCEFDSLEYYEKNYKWIRILQYIPVLRYIYFAMIKSINDLNKSESIKILFDNIIYHYTIFLLLDDPNEQYIALYDVLDIYKNIMYIVGGNNRFYSLEDDDFQSIKIVVADIYKIYTGTIDKEWVINKLKEEFEVEYFLSEKFELDIHAKIVDIEAGRKVIKNKLVV